MKIPKVEFDIYCKLNGSILIKLNKTKCKDSKISLSIPVIISEDKDKLDTNGEYYNDKCNKATSDSGTDILLKDRQKEFVEGNKTVCQDDCDFKEYDDISQKANCSCKVQETSSSIANMTINTNKLYDNFAEANNKKEVSNLGVTSCNVLGSTENIKSNTGFFLLLIILAIFIIIFIIFCTKGYNSLENKIDEVIHKKFKNEKQNNNKIKRSSLLTEIRNRAINRKININPLQPRKNQKNKTQKFMKKNSTINSKNKSINSKNSFLNRKRTQHLPNNRKKIDPLLIGINNINKNKKQNISQNKPDTDYEFNWLEYKQALMYDKRSNCEYYGSLIKSKQLIMFTFCSFNDYNSGVVKKFMFFLSFALHYTVNALFFDESNLHQIYEDQGKYNFIYQLPYIIYSSIISTATLRLMLQFLVLTDKDVLQVKLQSTKNMAINMKKEKLKYMKIKFAIFFILNFILLGLFWYYLTSFNAIYENTQIYLIKNTFISFAFSLLYPFIINIFPMMIRNCAIHSKSKDQEYCYKVSQVLQLI